MNFGALSHLFRPVVSSKPAPVKNTKAEPDPESVDVLSLVMNPLFTNRMRSYQKYEVDAISKELPGLMKYYFTPLLKKHMLPDNVAIFKGIDALFSRSLILPSGNHKEIIEKIASQDNILSQAFFCLQCILSPNEIFHLKKGKISEPIEIIVPEFKEPIPFSRESEPSKDFQHSLGKRFKEYIEKINDFSKKQKTPPKKKIVSSPLDILDDVIGAELKELKAIFPSKPFKHLEGKPPVYNGHPSSISSAHRFFVERSVLQSMELPASESDVFRNYKWLLKKRKPHPTSDFHTKAFFGSAMSSKERKKHEKEVEARVIEWTAENEKWIAYQTEEAEKLDDAARFAIPPPDPWKPVEITDFMRSFEGEECEEPMFPFTDCTHVLRVRCDRAATMLSVIARYFPQRMYDFLKAHPWCLEVLCESIAIPCVQDLFATILTGVMRSDQMKYPFDTTIRADAQNRYDDCPFALHPIVENVLPSFNHIE
ncbi:hypothetical protein ADUPG1_000373, partial [Aduncisulcus paluster]